jgi:hypothetical protein
MVLHVVLVLVRVVGLVQLDLRQNANPHCHLYIDLHLQLQVPPQLVLVWNWNAFANHRRLNCPLQSHEFLEPDLAPIVLLAYDDLFLEEH